MVKVGDKITLQSAPTRDGSDGGYALGVIAADGTTVLTASRTTHRRRP